MIDKSEKEASVKPGLRECDFLRKSDFWLTSNEQRALMRILTDHRSPLEARRSVPTGKTLGEVTAELELCKSLYSQIWPGTFAAGAELTPDEQRALARILTDHRSALEARRSVPTGKTLGEVTAELELCKSLYRQIWPGTFDEDNIL